VGSVFCYQKLDTGAMNLQKSGLREFSSWPNLESNLVKNWRKLWTTPQGFAMTGSETPFQLLKIFWYHIIHCNLESNSKWFNRGGIKPNWQETGRAHALRSWFLPLHYWFLTAWFSHDTYSVFQIQRDEWSPYYSWTSFPNDVLKISSDVFPWKFQPSSSIGLVLVVI
jgi:hypothetical protein